MNPADHPASVHQATPALTKSPVARPLGPSAKALLILGVCAVIALCYLFSLAAMTLLIAFLAIELIVFVALLRFGMVRIITPVMERHAGLLTLFARSLWLRKGDTSRVPLRREEAPRLFVLLDSLAARLSIAVPREVVVEMTVGAWVELRGLRQGSKATRLGLGYDLLAGLSETEVEAVLAHEMAHARLVRRGLQTWLRGGFARIATLTTQLSTRQENFRRAKKSFAAGAAALACADACTRLAAKLMAAYSRQDEFEADLGAAQLCGSASLRSALEKLHGLSLATSRLGWPERIAKLQQGSGYSAWLLTELTTEAASSAVTDLPDETVTDPYATHPSIPDRLAALPPSNGAAPVSPPAIGLILDPDALADRVITELEHLSARQEARDDRQLLAYARKIRSGASIRPLQVVALLLLLGAVVLGIASMIDGFNIVWFLIALAGLATGVWLYRFGRYNKTLSLPTPSYGLIQDGLERLRDYDDLGVHEKRIHTALVEAAAGLRAKKAAAFYQKRAFESLASCNFLEAHVAGRLGIQAHSKSVPCVLAFVIAAGALRQLHLVGQNLHFLKNSTGIRTPDTLWGVAWSLYLAGDWSASEALLGDLIKLRGTNATVHLLLSDCAARRGKRQTALSHARTAVELEPVNIDALKLLLDQLLACGYVREAGERLSLIPVERLAHPSLRLTRIRLHLLRQEFDDVHALESPLLAESATDTTVRLQLAAAHEGIRRHQRARELYEEVTRLGHYPEALVGLGRISGRLGQRDDARRHLLSALNTKVPASPKAVPALALFSTVTQELLALRGPGVPCRAWIATFTATTAAGPLANTALVVFGRDEAEVASDIKTLADAIIPGHALTPAHTEFRLAPKDRQPAGAVIPGVQYVWQ